MSSTDPAPGLDHRSPTLGTMARVALWLLKEIGEGNTFTKRDLRETFPDAANVDRRVRDLRGYGWQLDTSREDPTLAVEELRLAKIGTAVWDPQKRRAAHPPKRITDVRYQAVPFETPADLRSVREQVAALPHDDKVLVLAWLVKGRRDHTLAEQAFAAAQTLPAEDRQALMTQLADDLVGRLEETR